MEIIEEFDFKNKNCIVARMRTEDIEYYTGFVQVAKKDDKIYTIEPKMTTIDYTYRRFKSELNTVNIGFSGEVEDKDGFYMGFDTLENNKLNTKEGVKLKLKELVNEMLEKNIFKKLKQKSI